MLSVIIPVYNAEQTIERCVLSVIEQAYTDLEILLVDDGSTDASVELCEQLCTKDSRIILLQQQNKGPSAARNLALEYATGDYVAFVDSDDWISSETYQAMIDEAHTSDADMVICGYERIYSDKTEVGITGISSGFYNYSGCCEITENLVFSPPGHKIPPFLVIRIIRRSLIEEKGLRFDENLRRTEDFMFLVQVHLACSEIKAITDKCFYKYVQNASSITHTYTKNYWHMVMYIFKKLLSLVGNNKELNLRTQKMLIYRAVLAILNEASSGADRPIEHIKEILKTPELSRNIKNTPIAEGVKLYGKGFLFMKLSMPRALLVYARLQTSKEYRRVQ